jgi:Ferredoxin-dependent bilin reductase
MSEEYTFPPYDEEISKILKKFGGERMETYNGEDVTPLWDLKGEGLAWSFKYLYAAPKLEKIVHAVQSYKDKLMVYGTIIWPDDTHALPIYSAFWAESAKGSFFLLDYYPIADCICDIPYMEKYLEPLEDIFNKGIEYYSDQGPGRNPNWYRALLSPYAIAADIFPGTKKDQSRILELMTGYLNVYHSLWEKDESRDPEYMKTLIARKEAMRKNLRDKDPGGFMMEKAVGEKVAELSIKAYF